LKVPILQGVIRRRLLLNYEADPECVARMLPAPLEPKRVNGKAVVGICLIRLEQIRPKHLPTAVGVSSENAAHRFAVSWPDATGAAQEGVYIPRRDTDSLINHIAGGRLFPGEHHRATFDVSDANGAIELRMAAQDGERVTVSARETGTFTSKLFASLDEASAFFRGGALGYSERTDGERLDGIKLDTREWTVRPLEVTEVHSTFFERASLFPAGALRFDCGLLMRDIPHEWHAQPDLQLRGRPALEPRA
jgi:hypothetical protein